MTKSGVGYTINCYKHGEAVQSVELVIIVSNNHIWQGLKQFCYEFGYCFINSRHFLLPTSRPIVAKMYYLDLAGLITNFPDPISGWKMVPGCALICTAEACECTSELKEEGRYQRSVVL